MKKGLFLALAACMLYGSHALARHDGSRGANYNVWICDATLRGGSQGAPVYKGYSQIFAQGSGQGQEARIQARENALDNCEWSTDRRCHARIEDCNVKRFQLGGGGSNRARLAFSCSGRYLRGDLVNDLGDNFSFSVENGSDWQCEHIRAELAQHRSRVRGQTFLGVCGRWDILYRYSVDPNRGFTLLSSGYVRPWETCRNAATEINERN